MAMHEDSEAYLRILRDYQTKRRGHTVFDSQFFVRVEVLYLFARGLLLYFVIPVLTLLRVLSDQFAFELHQL